MKHYSIFNICAYAKRERVLKETITAANASQARSVTNHLLTQRGFQHGRLRIEILRLPSDVLSRLN